jgi:hypothetical protein
MTYSYIQALEFAAKQSAKTSPLYVYNAGANGFIVSDRGTGSKFPIVCIVERQPNEAVNMRMTPKG